MDTAFRIIITAIVAGILGSQISFDSSPAEATTDTETVVVAGFARRAVEPVAAPEPLVFDNATPAQVELMTDAIATFEAAGLELPPLVVTFDMDGEACKGHPGLFTKGIPAVIQLCTEMRHVVLHELAHAWEWHTLEDSARDEFVAEQGLPTWNFRDFAWEERGVEEFADIVAIGLTLVNGSDNPTVVEKLCVFEDITGYDNAGLTDTDCDHHDHDH